MEKQEQKEGHTYREGMVHVILSHSYSIFLIAIILGAIFHVFFPINLMPEPVGPYVGFVMIMLGSALIYWAQSTTRCTTENRHTERRSESDFEQGPYKYTRNPTHIGLTVMTLGLAVIFNSFFTVLFIILASLITKIFFLKKEEAILEQKYGDTYCEYKKKVSTWI